MIDGEALLLGCTVFWILSLTACAIFLMKSDGGTFFGKDEQD
jgi:hypothetical protein